GPFAEASGIVGDAYEIHAGLTRVLTPEGTPPFAIVERGGAPADGFDGAMVGAVAGTYLPGVLAGGAVRRALLRCLAARAGRALLGHRLGGAGVVVEGAALKSTLALRDLARAARGVSTALAAHDLAGGGTQLGFHLVSRPTAALDASQVASGAIESMAENLPDA